MSARANPWKLGLFVVLGTLLCLSAGAFVIARHYRQETVTYRTYFDEAVGGLDVGAMVSFRGVRVGYVSSVQVAPDRRHVEARYQLETHVLPRLGLALEQKGKERISTVPRDLRVQLSTKSIAGDKYLRLDFFDPRRSPLPKLPFNPGPNYIPATPSTLKNLEESVMGALERVPELVSDVKTILNQTNDLLADLRHKELPQRAAALLGRTDALVGTMERAVKDLHTGDFSMQTQATLANLDDTLLALRRVMERAQRQGGVMEGLERASFAMGDLAQRAGPASGELEETLRSLRDMADTVQRLADALERDSDMLLKGRARERRP